MVELRWRKWTKLAATALVVAYVGATAVRVYVRKYYLFLPDYARWTVTPAEQAAGPVHIFLLFADHFEPAGDVKMTQEWDRRYRELASRHRDADGRPPQHSWFYPGEQPSDPIFAILRALMQDGLGEVELHLHHKFDTLDSGRKEYVDAIQRMQQYGFLKTRDGRTHFAFVHGNFGLDNANGDGFCGITDEIALLRELGCFADYTFPSTYMSSQPATVNRIYATKDDPGPKSYNRVMPLSALENKTADLMIFEGPLLIAPSLNVKRLFLDVDDGDVHAAGPGSAERADRWVKADVHVDGRPDWVFIKLFTHGISSPAEEDTVVGKTFDDTLTYLEQRYNDGERYVLHYVTAREAFNLAMAAADGKRGNPVQYYDRTIPPYIATRAFRESDR
jgi:hypothetical protein